MYTSQQTRVAERMSRAIINTAKAMLNQIFVPKEFRADAVTIALYGRNRVTCAGIPANQTLFELWSGRKPGLGLLGVFGVSLLVSFAQRATQKA